MNTLKIFLSSLFITLLAFFAEAQELDALQKAFMEKYDAINAIRDKKIESLSSGYISALERLQIKLQSTGDLEPVLLVKDEISRIKDQTTPLEALPDKAPTELKTMRTTYVGEETKNLKEHADALVQLADKMQVLLAEKTKQFTKDGKLEDAQVAQKISDTLNADTAIVEARTILGKTAASADGWTNLWQQKEKWLIKQPAAWEQFQAYDLPKFEVKGLKKSECIFAHATSSFSYDIDQRSTKVNSLVGLSDRGTVTFIILADEKEIFRKTFTGPMLKPQEVNASYSNAKSLVFISDSAGPIDSDQAVWIRTRIK